MALPKTFKVVGTLVAVGTLAAVATIKVKEKIEEIEKRKAEQEAFNEELNRLQRVLEDARNLQYDDDDDDIIYYA